MLSTILTISNLVVLGVFCFVTLIVLIGFFGAKNPKQTDTGFIILCVLCPILLSIAISLQQLLLKLAR